MISTTFVKRQHAWLPTVKTLTTVSTLSVRKSISQHHQQYFYRLYSTNTVEKCPKPEYDTGCTFCKPEDLSLFENDRRNPNNTAPFLEKFVIINDGHSDWPSKPDLVPDSFGSEFTMMRRRVLDPSFPVVMVHSDTPPLNKSKSSEVLLYPDAKLFPDIKTSQTRLFMESYLVPPKEDQIENKSKAKFNLNDFLDEPEDIKLSNSSDKFNPIDIPYNTILICGHTHRDARCGQIGPLIKNEFEKVLKKQDMLYDPIDQAGDKKKWNVSLCSHVGGHVYAGNIIILKEGTSGLWYGNVFPSHVQGIVQETLLSGNIIQELHRGGGL